MGAIVTRECPLSSFTNALLFDIAQICRFKDQHEYVFKCEMCCSRFAQAI